MRLLTTLSFVFLALTTQPALPERPADAKTRSVKWEALEGRHLSRARTEVGFSNTLEGTVSHSVLDVYVLVSSGRQRRWRAFPATVSDIPNSRGDYPWRALVNLGRLDGRGKGKEFTVRVVALDKERQERRGRRLLPPGALHSQDVKLRRVH